MSTSKLLSSYPSAMLTSLLLHGGLLLLLGLNITKSPALVPKGEPWVEVSLKQRQKTRVTQEMSRHARKDQNSKEVILSKTDSPALSVEEAAATAGPEGESHGSELVSHEQRYLFELQKLLERKKVYPPMAKAMGLKGVVRVEFTLNQLGEVQNVKLLENSHQILDKAAESLVLSISKLKPLPGEIKKVSWTIQVPIEYQLR